jgi:hypothetical protein
MKYSKLFAIVFVVIVFVLFLRNRPMRESLCSGGPSDAQSQADCARSGGVFVNGTCKCGG